MDSTQSGSASTMEQIKDILRDIEGLKECSDVIHAIVEYVDWLHFFKPRDGHKILIRSRVAQMGGFDYYTIDLIVRPNNKCDLWFKHYYGGKPVKGTYEPIAENIDFVAEYSANYQLIQLGGDNSELQKHFAYIKQELTSEKCDKFPSYMFDIVHMDSMKSYTFNCDWEYIGYFVQFATAQCGHITWTMSTHKDKDLKQMKDEKIKQARQDADYHEFTHPINSK